ncbi:MAG: hypothetical protein KKF77_01680 [Proteobacteria bacterium]|nr:hypothetical protein [Pseudomonadota bacterium]
MKLLLISAMLVAFLIPCDCIAADSITCMTFFYKTRDIACISTVADSLRTAPATQVSKGASHFQASVGFLAEVFQAYPQEKSRLLKVSAPPLAQEVYFEALCRAGLQDEAKRYAEANGLSAGLKHLQHGGTTPLKQLKTATAPGENDLLIGAYMATGNTQHIKTILAGYSSAPDTVASDAFRFGLMQGRSGQKNPRNGQATMARAGCQKYACKTDMHNFMRVLTLSSAYWALQSLGQRDEGIKKTFSDFFDSNPRLNLLRKTEHAAFSNYMTMLITLPATNNDPSIEAFLSSYENLGSPKDAETALLHSPLFKKKQN